MRALAVVRRWLERPIVTLGLSSCVGGAGGCGWGSGPQLEAPRAQDAGAPVLTDAAPREPALSADAAAQLSRDASACLSELACPASEAARLLLAAADAQSPEIDCFRLLDGALTPRDAVRGRACLERTAGSVRCAGSPIDLAMAELAIMRIDGVGGKADITGARALIGDCADDVSRAEVLAHANAKERDPAAPALTFCEQIRGTLLTSDTCRGRTRDTADERLQLAAKAVFASIDDVGKHLFAAAHRAHAAYVTSMTYFRSTRFEAGSSRGAVGLVLATRLLDARAAELAAFQSIGAADTPKEDVERAIGHQRAAIAKLRLVVPKEKNAFRQTELKWTAYRDAEIALYEHVFGGARGTPRARAAITAYLAERRAHDVEP